jgi:hypothetical protein
VVPVKRKIFHLEPDGSCPCGSGRPLRKCCLLPNGLLRKQPPTLLPPPPRTGYAHPRCYLAGTNDCSNRISAEHYMSKSVLAAIGTTVGIDGAPWLPPGEQREIGIDRLTAKILCGRHNSALSPLDSEASSFFEKLRIIEVDLQRRSLSKKRSLSLTSGEMLEAWMLKLTCGLFYSKNAAKDGARLIDDHTLDEQLVREALLFGLWRDGCGLYIKPPQGSRIPDADRVSMTPLIALNENRVVGAGLLVSGLVFEVIFDPTDVNKEGLFKEGWIHRPSELLFEIQTRAHSIFLTWLPGTPPNAVRMINRRDLAIAR